MWREARSRDRQRELVRLGGLRSCWAEESAGGGWDSASRQRERGGSSGHGLRCSAAGALHGGETDLIESLPTLAPDIALQPPRRGVGRGSEQQWEPGLTGRCGALRCGAAWWRKKSGGRQEGAKHAVGRVDRWPQGGSLR